MCYTTLDLHLQRLAQDAVRDGLTRVDQLLVATQAQGRAEAALIAVDPRTGEILAFVGGRSYNQSQYNRAIVVATPAGIGFQAVRLPDGVRTGGGGRPHRRHAGVDRRRRAGNLRVRRSGLDAGELRGQVRRPDHASAARSHTRATSRRFTSREQAGYDTRCRILEEAWRRQRRRSRIRRSRSACSKRHRYEIATAYTLFPNQGTIRPLQAHPADHQRRQGRHEEASTPSRARSRGRTRRFSSRT